MNTTKRNELLGILQARFETNRYRHPKLLWTDVRARLENNPKKLRSLLAMEETGGEPDVVARETKTGAYVFMDCAAESPKGRRSLCYDDEALASRKEHKPEGSAVGMAASMGIELLTEAEYRQLQEVGEFDLKTSSWVATPEDVRARGGGLFCDRRYGRVFLYHNGAESYYAARGFRAKLSI
ncbi:MAG: DUF4256 domain-containing protein [Bacteroidota bacterium]|jgi:hypothetical protein|nr:DUF4256 domain-containing protein [Bacteroidota bacterium]